MNSIYHYIQNLDRSFWDYYSDISNNQLSNPFINEFSHSEFIKEYFQISGKSWVISDSTIDIDSLRKVSHVTSVFFLGTLAYYNTDFKTKVFIGNNQPGYRIFPFIWFMTSLFHDFAYEYELDENSLEKIKDIDSIYKIFKIDNFLFKQNIDGISKRLFSCCENYFFYRRNSMKKIDHGIFAGLYLYDKLVKIRQKKELEINDPRYWGKDLEKQYALASASIAMHNIWFPKKEDEKNYEKFKLRELINIKPLKYKDYPLLYLLGIIDTLEPIKLFLELENGINERYIYENLLIDIKPNSIAFANSKDSILDFKRLMLEAIKIIGWLDVKINLKNNSLQIVFQ